MFVFVVVKGRLGLRKQIATPLMLKTHESVSGVCGVLTKRVADVPCSWCECAQSVVKVRAVESSDRCLGHQSYGLRPLLQSSELRKALRLLFRLSELQKAAQNIVKITELRKALKDL
ncbi:unnamed protein product [Arabidopsis lyrata]|nr:unnamed protein product [Arabidopsis lyrata]